MGVREAVKALFNPEAETVHVKNAGPWPLKKGEADGLSEGAPKATEHFTTERLKADGVVGLYRAQTPTVVARVGQAVAALRR